MNNLPSRIVGEMEFDEDRGDLESDFNTFHEKRVLEPSVANPYDKIDRNRKVKRSFSNKIIVITAPSDLAKDTFAKDNSQGSDAGIEVASVGGSNQVKLSNVDDCSSVVSSAQSSVRLLRL